MTDMESLQAGDAKSVKAAIKSSSPEAPIFHRLSSMTASNGQQPIDILLIGLGSIGSVYAYILEKVT